MVDAVRYDIGELRRPEITDQGFLRADAGLSRTGILLYANADGTTRREYRPPDEVFREDSLKTFEDAPVTMGHPARLLDAASAKEHTRGWCKERARRDGDWTVGRLTITEKNAIEKAQSGCQLSVGYRVDYDPTPGVTPEGVRYDGVQRNIRVNHIALVDVGRAGPGASFRLDSADAVMAPVNEPGGQKPPHQETKTMATKTIRIDGVDYEASEQLVQVIDAQSKRHQQRVDEFDGQVKTLKEEIGRLTARADKAEADAKKSEKDRTDALSPAELDKRVNARAAIVSKAREVLGNEVKLDGLNDAQIKRQVLEKLHPETKARLDGLEDGSVREAYLSARYDEAIETFDKRPNKSLAATRRDAGATGTGELTVAQRMEKVRQDQANAWKTTPGKTE